MNNEEFDKMMDQIADKLFEHADCVRIFMSRHDDGDTESFTIGRGNFHAQRDQVREWLQMQKQYVKERAKLDARKDDGND